MNPSEIAERAAREITKYFLEPDRETRMEQHIKPIAEFVERAIEESRGQRWIPVEEKLPDYENVLVYDRYWDSRYLAIYVGDHWEAVDERAEPIQISHWMPIADPPKGNENV